MTNEEAIEYIEKWKTDYSVNAKDREVLSMAIKALGQQSCEDCISREAVLKIQAKYAEHIGATKFWQMRDDIKALLSVTPKAEWIPVSEKPAEGKYLVTEQYRKIRYVDIATFDGEDAEDTYSWDSYSDEYKIERRKHKVIAYMPLPKPYKAESEE